MLPAFLRLAEGLRTTMMNSCSALGPSLSVMRFVSSLEIGFSMNQLSCLTSELTSWSLPESSGKGSDVSYVRWNLAESARLLKV